MNGKKIIVTVLLSIGFFAVRTQTLHWTSFEDLQDSLRHREKQILVFIHTDWCKYCKMQEKFTFKDPEVIQALNSGFYCLSLDAEERRDIVIFDTKYQFQPVNGYHQLAELLGKQNGELIFPTTIIMNSNLKLIHFFLGLLKPESLKEWLGVDSRSG